ncbi:MAG: hypothetical protein ACLS3T_16815 [Anaerobutyricum sp.]
MEQVKIEQFAFLYLCSEHDKRLLFKKEKMQLADFDRLTYLIYHLGFKEYHIKVWMEFTGDFKKEWECLNALRETGGSVGNIGSTKSEIRLHEIWIQDFCKNVSTEVRRWIQDLDYK